MQIQSPALNMRTGHCRDLKPSLILLWIEKEDLLVGVSKFSLKLISDTIAASDESSKKWAI
jgi:hypothetical protein